MFFPPYNPNPRKGNDVTLEDAQSDDLPEYDVAPTKEAQWRQEELLRAGYDPLHAALLASDRAVDLQRARTLVTQTTPELAFRILH